MANGDRDLSVDNRVGPRSGERLATARDDDGTAGVTVLQFDRDRLKSWTNRNVDHSRLGSNDEARPVVT